MARKVYAIRSGEGGWPPEVWTVFACDTAAREYLERARWEFRIETMPAYDSYEECPIENRGLGSGSSEIALESLGQGKAEHPGWTALADAGPGVDVVYAVAAHDSPAFDYSEVELFYTAEAAADEDVADRYAMSIVVPFALYRRYEDCPEDRRFDGGGRPPGWSQLLNPKQ